MIYALMGLLSLPTLYGWVASHRTSFLLFLYNGSSKRLQEDLAHVLLEANFTPLLSSRGVAPLVEHYHTLFSSVQESVEGGELRLEQGLAAVNELRASFLEALETAVAGVKLPKNAVVRTQERVGPAPHRVSVFSFVEEE